MAGLARVQQRFNAAVITILALAGLGRMNGVNAKEEAAKGSGHPIHAKYLRSQNILKILRRGSPYPGYCSGLDYRNRKGATLRRVRTPGEVYGASRYPAAVPSPALIAARKRNAEGAAQADQRRQESQSWLRRRTA